MNEYKGLNTTRQRFKHIVWTYAMRRMLVLVGQAMFYKEPILLVGETGLEIYMYFLHFLYLYYLCKFIFLL